MISYQGNFTEDDLKATLHNLGNDVFFLQVGAMDGVTYDPIHQFVVAQHWKGVLVEPIPHIAHFLRKNYEGCEGLVFVEKAITDYEGTIEMSTLDPKASEEGAFVRGAFGISTVMPDRGILAGNNLPADRMPVFQKYTQKITVPCCRLTTLLKEQNITHLDLMVVDVEGADWMVTRQLPLDVLRPRVVYIEIAHISDYEKNACANHFVNHGYRIYLEQETGENFLAVRND